MNLNEKPEFLVKSIIVDSGENFKLLVKWDGSFTNFVLLGGSVWEGTFDENKAKNFTDALDTDYLSYYKDLKDNFKGDIFSYSFINGLFSWSKKTEDISITYGSVGLIKKDATEVLAHMMDTLNDFNKDLLHEQAIVTRQTEELSSLKALLEALTISKNEMEKELYSKFLTILNEKKRYIRRTLKNEDTNRPGTSTSSD